MPMLVVLLAVVAMAISLPLTWLLIGLGRRWGQVDRPDAMGSGGRKNHARPVPSTGGIAIVSAIVLPMLAALAAAWWAPTTWWSGTLAPMAPHVEGLREQTPSAVAIIGAVLVMHVLGLVDDRRHLSPYLKLVVQLIVAAVLVVGFDMAVLQFLGTWYGLAGVVISVTLSVVWIVVITNAMNFLDNMDGLSGGVGAICAGLYVAATLIGGQWFVAAVAALSAGAVLGFLVFNVTPARVFMGDAGSLVLGLLLAVVSVRTTYFDASAEPLPGAWYGVLMPLMVLAVPLYDFTSVTLLRLSRGQSPFVGDQQHFSHRLVRKGLSKRSAVVVIWLCTLATGLSGVMLGSLAGWQAALAAAQTVAVVAVLAMLERAGGWEG